MAPVAITAFTATTALGAGLDAQASALRERRSGMRRNDFGPQPLECWIGRVAGVEDVVLPDALQGWDCRNNQLAWLALQQDGMAAAVQAAAQRYGAERVAVVMGTSTSSVGASEEAYTRLVEDAHGLRFPDDLQRPIVHTPHSLGDFVQHARLMAAGVVDAALVGGVDTLCGSVLFGFNSLQVVAPQLCQPFDARRVGLSLGEAGGFALLERPAAAPDAAQWLYGYGESSDAHHMSAPHPQGLGAQLAMRGALDTAGLDAAAVGYLNLHGTATPANDSVEAAAVAAIFPDTLHASSTKAWMGHTLGAAGIVESVIALLALRDGLLPGTLNSAVPDPACGPQIRFDNAHSRIQYAMNNSFGFGGNNCSLLFGQAR